MSWQWPNENEPWRAQAEQVINLLKTEIEQLWKRQPQTPENLLGAMPFDPGYGLSSGSGEAVRTGLLGKTVSSITKGSTGSVTIYTYNGTSDVVDTGPTGGTITVRCPFGSVGANKWVWCAFDIETETWYITAAECGS